MTTDPPFPEAAPARPIWLVTLADLALLLVGFLVLVQATGAERRPALLNGLRAQLAAVPAPGAAVPKPVPAVTKTVGGAVPAATPRLKPPVTSPPAKAVPAKTAPAPKPVPAKKAASPVAAGKYRVQVAAFASQANAKGLAAKIGGHIVASGKYWRVELGPFADAAAAKRARDGVAKHGYGDASVITD